MKKTLTAIIAMATVATAMPASAQYYGHRDRDRYEHRGDRYDRHDRWDRNTRWRTYGGSYGYNGYDGRWRTGMRYPYWRDRSYYVTNYYDYGLPAPRPGYRYYRDSNGDIVMVAVASGIIGAILGSSLSGNHHRW